MFSERLLTEDVKDLDKETFFKNVELIALVKHMVDP